jgi:hypothetical protein
MFDRHCNPGVDAGKLKHHSCGGPTGGLVGGGTAPARAFCDRPDRQRGANVLAQVVVLVRVYNVNRWLMIFGVGICSLGWGFSLSAAAGSCSPAPKSSATCWKGGIKMEITKT